MDINFREAMLYQGTTLSRVGVGEDNVTEICSVSRGRLVRQRRLSKRPPAGAVDDGEKNLFGIFVVQLCRVFAVELDHAVPRVEIENDVSPIFFSISSRWRYSISTSTSGAPAPPPPGTMSCS